MKKIKKFFKLSSWPPNEQARDIWLASTLKRLPRGLKILDAGAGELRNKKHCEHLIYVSQDFNQYHGHDKTEFNDGLGPRTWDVSKIDIVSDIISIPLADESFDIILCSEVLEHVPDPCLALNELERLLKPNGTLILTAPFNANVHFAPYFFCTGFSKYWYKTNLEKRNFTIQEITPNGNWFTLLQQELCRLGSSEKMERRPFWPFACLFANLVIWYLQARKQSPSNELACFGYHCIAKKNPN